MADDLPQVDDLGRPYDDTINPPPKVTPERTDNYFSQFLTGDEKPYKDMGFGQRFTDTAKAGFYSGSIVGTGIAANQADPAGRSRALNEGLSSEEQALNNKIVADWEAQDIAKRKEMESPVTVTDAQVAQIQNKLHPSIGGVGDAAADVLGGLAGPMASPEMWLLPSFKAAEGIAAAAPATARFLDGMAGRMVNTGVSMSVLNTATNPVIQKQSEAAGLQPEFDPMRLALAPLEGFIGGAVMHGGMEALGRGAGYFGSQVRKGFDQRIWDHITNPLKDDPAFRVAGERPPMVEPGKVGEAPAMPDEIGGTVTRPAPQPLEATSPDHARKITQDLAASADWTPEQRAAVREYATIDSPAAEQTFLKEKGDVLQSAAIPAPEDMVLYRGGHPSDDLTARNQATFFSASTDKAWAATHGEARYGGDEGLERIVIRKGEPIIPVELPEGAGVGNEAEVLIPRNAKMRQTGTEQVRSPNYPYDVQQRNWEIGPASFADEARAAGVNPADISRDLSARAEARGEPDLAAAHEAAALERAYEQPETRAAVRTHYGKFKVQEPKAESAPSLTTFLKNNGGLKPDGDLDRIFGRGSNHQKGKGRLIRKDGQSLDDALKAAADAGYIKGDHQSLSVADLLDAIKEDADGRKVYPEGMDKASIAERRAYDRQTAELDAAEKHIRDQVKFSEDAEPPPDQVWRDAASHMVFGGERDPHVAFDRAVLDYEREAGHEIHGSTARSDGEQLGGTRQERAGYDEEGRLSGAGEGFPGFEPTGQEPGSRETAGTGGTGRTETGADGKPQQLIPGVEPVTDRQRAELAASKPLKGGDAPAGGMFDEANTAQSDLQFREKDPNAPSGMGGGDQAGAAARVAERGEAVQSLQQQSLALGDTLGIPVRQGRLQGGKRVVGQYSRLGVSRVREIPDFETVAHEGGHALEQKVGPELSGLISRHTGELGPMDYDPAKARPAEGFAEWFSLSLTNPAAAQLKAPGFTAAFRTFMGQRDPALMDALDNAAAAFSRYINAPSDVRVASQVVQKGETGWFAETKEFLHKEGFPATIGKVLADGYTAFFDDKAPVARTVRNMARLFRENNGGELLDLKSADNPEILLRLFARAQQGAIYQMRYGVVPYRGVMPEGASLHDAIATATGASPILGRWVGASVDDFSTYLVAKRAAVLWDRFNDGHLEHPPAGFSKADAVETMRVLSEANKGFEQGSQMVHDYTRNMLKKQRDAGLIDQDLFETLSKDPFYVPLFRDVSDKPLSGKTAGGGSSDGPGMTDTIKRLRGSSRDIIDPIQGIMMQTFLAERTIRHNDIIKAFANLAERVGPGAGAYVEPIRAKELRGTSFDLAENIKSVARQRGLDPNDTALLMNSVTNAFGDDPIMGTMFQMQPASKKGEPILFYKEAGELKAARFTAGKEGERVYEILSSLPDATKDLALQVMQGAASTLRFGVTANPVFIATNFIRDQMALGILRPDYVPFASGMRGLKSEVTQNEAAQMYAYFGGVSPGAAVTDTRGMMDANVGSIAVKGYGSARLNLSSPKEFAHGVVEAMQITEAASRNSVFAKVYEQKIAQGLTPYEAAIEAAYQGTDILDFGRHGSRTMALRQLVPFLNAHLQGLDLGRRTILEPLARAARGEVLTTREQAQVKNAYLSMLKFSAVGSSLGFAYASLAWDREEYRDANNDMKATHLIIPWGHKVLTIPKPFELSLGFNAGEAAYAALVGKDPRAAANFTEGAWEVLKLPNPITGNPLIKTTFEVALNRNLFTGRDIVPDSLKAVDPQHQFTERTSMFARKTGDITNAISDFLKDHTNSAFATMTGFGDAWSPIKVDYAIGSLFGMWGKDIQAASNWFAGDDDKPESQFEDMVFLRRFLKDPNRSGEMTKRYFEFAAQKTGQYAQAVNTYDRYMNMYQDQKAQDWMATLPSDKKAFVTLNAGADDEGARKFSADDRRLHPVTRAQNAMGQLNSITRELTFNSQINTETGERFNLTAVQRRDAIEAVRQLGAQEMRNALVMVGDKGYEGRSVLDAGQQFKVIEAISPEVAAEVSRRYATGKVLPAASVAEVWPEARKRLLQDGSEADLSDLTSDANAAGYEFGGERTSKREKRRKAIKGARELDTAQ